jgi:para-nitrobenzyl esterase
MLQSCRRTRVPYAAPLPGEYRLFQGIPYAAFTAGDHRWRPPAPVRAWTELRDATKPGHICVQQPSVYADVASLEEDCLFSR